MKVAAYLRVSTAEQENTGLSLDAQQAKVFSYAKLYDLEILHVFRESYSAKTLQRPEFHKVLNLLKTREIEGVVVTKLDRISRNLGDWNYLVSKHFGQGQANLFSVDDHIDTKTAAGRMMLNILMTVSQWEREIISERTKEVLTYKRLRNERVGRIPYGFDLMEDGKTLVFNEKEQQAMRIIGAMKETGKSYREIAQQLDSLGFKTKSGSPWCHSSVAQIHKRSMNLLP